MEKRETLGRNELYLRHVEHILFLSSFFFISKAYFLFG